MSPGVVLVGAGRAPVRFPEAFFPFAGFSGVRDDLICRTVLIDEGGRRTAFVVVDVTSILDPRPLRELAARESGTPFERVILCASHTFLAPHLKPSASGPLSASEQTYLDAVTAAVGASAVQAAKSLRPGRLAFGSGVCDVNINRDVFTAQGYWKGANPSGPSDKSVSVLKLEDLGGHPVALVMNYAVQSCVLLDSGDKKLVSGDLAGAACRAIEAAYGDGFVAAFTTGAAGDQDPLFVANRHVVDRQGVYRRRDAGPGGDLLLEVQAERLAAAVAAAADQARPEAVPTTRIVHGEVVCPGHRGAVSLADLKPTLSYDYQPGPDLSAPFVVWTLGSTAWVGVQVELVCRTAEEIRALSPFEHTVVVTMVNGAAKYMADAWSYDHFTYAAMNSRAARGSAEALRDAVVSGLRSLHP